MRMMQVLRSMRTAYLAFMLGLTANLLLLAALLSTPSSRDNLWVPELEHAGNIWHGSDVLTYVRPARSFNETGVFGKDHVPDFHRTIGLPAVFAFLMWAFPSEWQLAFLLCSAFFCSLIYPALVYVARYVVELDGRDERRLVLFCLVSAMYAALVPVLLTDMIFATLFTCGLAVGAVAIARQSWPLIFVQTLMLGAAAQVRPALLLYPIAHLAIMIAIAQRHRCFGERRTRWMIAISGVLLILVIALPTMRNAVHHGFLRPSDVPGRNLFNYMGKAVLERSGRSSDFAQMQAEVGAAASISEADQLRAHYGAQAALEHPLQTAQYLMLNGARLLAGNFWVQIGHFWGYHWLEDKTAEPAAQGRYRGSRVLFAVTLIWLVIYAAVWLLFIRFLLRLALQKRMFLAAGLSLLVLSFLLPAMMVRQGPRLRLPVEGVVVAGALAGCRASRLARRSEESRPQ